MTHEQQASDQTPPTLITGIPEHLRNGSLVDPSTLPVYEYAEQAESQFAPPIDVTIEGDSFEFAVDGRDYVQDTVSSCMDRHTNLPVEQQTDIAEILSRGTLHGADVEPRRVLRDVNGELDVRTTIANIYASNPGVAELLINKKVAGFHGTSSSAFAGMLEHGGMATAASLNERGAHMVTGEHIFQKPEGQDSISFSHIGELTTSLQAYGGATKSRTNEEVVAELEEGTARARQMAAEEESGAGNRLIDALKASTVRSERMAEEVRANPDGLYAEFMREQFPILVGVNYDFVLDTIPEDARRDITHGVNEMGEFRPFPKEIPFSELPVIAVPQEKVQRVHDLLQQYGHERTEVIPLEALAPGIRE